MKINFPSTDLSFVVFNIFILLKTLACLQEYELEVTELGTKAQPKRSDAFVFTTTNLQYQMSNATSGSRYMVRITALANGGRSTATEEVNLCEFSLLVFSHKYPGVCPVIVEPDVVELV